MLRMTMLDNMKAELITRAIMAGAKIVSHLDDKNLVSLLKLVKRIMTEPGAQQGLEELIEAAETGPPNTTLMRRMICESKYEELRDMIEGALFYHEIDLEEL